MTKDIVTLVTKPSLVRRVPGVTLKPAFWNGRNTKRPGSRGLSAHSVRDLGKNLQPPRGVEARMPSARRSR